MSFSFAQEILDDLRKRRLLPVAVLLLILLIAVPVLLGGGSSTPSAGPAGSTAGPTAGLPTISVDGQPVAGRLTGAGRDPFGQGGGTSATVAAGSGSGSAGGGSTGGSSGGAGVTASGSGGSATAGGATVGGSATGFGGSSGSAGAPAPAGGLSATDAYQAAIGVTDPGGNVTTVNPLERLSELPSVKRPLVVYLGVLLGGQRLLFAVLPGTEPSGQGTCVPSPKKCQVISLAQNQIEGLSARGWRGETLSTLAVTAILTNTYPSPAAAQQARTAAAAKGAALLAKTHSPALSLFDYDPTQGALDARGAG